MRATVSVALCAALMFIGGPQIGAQNPLGTRNQVAAINQMPYADSFPDNSGQFNPRGNDLQQIQNAIKDCPAPPGCSVIIPADMSGASEDWTSGVDCTVNPLLIDYRGGFIAFGHKGAGTSCVVIPTVGGGTVTNVSPSTATNLDSLFTFSFTNPTTTPTLVITQPANTPAHAFFGVTGGAAGTAGFVQPNYSDLAGSIGMANLTGSPYGLSRVVPFLSSGTYTPTAGTRALYVECVGGGGGGGSAAATTTNSSVASGGGGGGYSASWITSGILASYTVTVSPGGAGGTAGGAGTAASDTIFGANLVVCHGGGAGLAGSTPGTATITVGQGPAAAAGTGDIALPGAAGGRPVAITNTVCMAGSGAGSFYGQPEYLTFWATAPAAGGTVNGVVPGGGGSGSLTCGITGGPVNGGAGAGGMIRIFEYF